MKLQSNSTVECHFPNQCIMKFCVKFCAKFAFRWIRTFKTSCFTHSSFERNEATLRQSSRHPHTINSAATVFFSFSVVRSFLIDTLCLVHGQQCAQRVCENSGMIIKSYIFFNNRSSSSINEPINATNHVKCHHTIFGAEKYSHMRIQWIRTSAGNTNTQNEWNKMKPPHVRTYASK